jgi:hypothetical protein
MSFRGTDGVRVDFDAKLARDLEELRRLDGLRQQFEQYQQRQQLPAISSDYDSAGAVEVVQVDAVVLLDEHVS